MSLLRRVPGNVVILLIFTLIVIFYYRPRHRFFQLDTSSLALYLNGSHTVQTLQSLASELTPDCEPIIQSIITTVSTTTEIQLITATETQTCPVGATLIPIELPSKAPLLEPTAEQQFIARLRQQGIVIIFKTGAQEVSHLSIQIGTTLRYLDPQDILFFSDLQGALGPFLINDALRNVDQALKETDSDFEIYRAIRRYQRTGQDIEGLKEDRSKGDGRSGWRLDKYKFLHMVEETFEMRPNAKWYVFIETDSYVLWENLAGWLGRLDSTKPWYLGAPAMLGGTAFGHGGSGYVLSNAAMNRLLGPDQPQGLAATWDKKMKGVCCGDLALAIALKEKGVDVRGAGPMLNGEKPATFSFGPHDHWCQPAVTMHHVLPHEVSAIWRYERRREILQTSSNGTIFADLYFHFVEPHLMESRDNWDNMSHGKTYSEEETKKEKAQKAEEDKMKLLEEEKEKAMAGKKKKQKGKEQEENAKIIAVDKAKQEKVLGSTGKENEIYSVAAKLGKETTAQKQSDAKAEAADPKKSAGVDQKGKKDAKPATKEKEKAGSNTKKVDKIKDNPNEKDAPHEKRLVKREDRNKPTEIEKVAHFSFENCAKACAAMPKCFQYVHHEKECKLGYSFRLGKYAAPGRGDRILWRSGWNVARIRKWTEENPCEGPQWPDWVESAE